MNNDKDILFQIIGREIDNLAGQMGPLASMFSGTIKNAVFNFISPYIDAFTNPTTKKINTDAVKEFTKQEVNSKVNDFLKNFESQINKNGSNDYIV